MFLGVWKFCSLAWDSLVYLFPDNLDSQLGAWHIPGGRYSIFSHWSTHGVTPVGCHSHNDYWREVPLRSAVSAGCIGVEADIWLSDNDLLVGHTRFTLHHDHTLRSLYIDPLLDILDKHNTPSSRLQPRRGDGADLAGVFANDPSQTLVLLIDFKTDPEILWPHVVEQLDSLRRAGYLTHFNGTTVVQRPITVVATGYAPFHLIVANSTYRDIFLDAPLDMLKTREPSPYEKLGLEEEAAAAAGGGGRGAEYSVEDYDVTNSYYASVDFRKAIGPLFHNRFSQAQLELLRAQVRAAHARGLKVRYWGTPSWPRGLRNHVWHILVREGVDLINVDDLREATMQDWRKHRSWFS
ncbi:Altered inheritance of mitochondria protein 6 [Paecilomyces lecythidis]|uniref:Altered inheritance of mitochondria protein 6 n=1 Tax=Paecilomyces lecythidis TaxID=3004212 RepID=A0ABR3YER9_9EURO